MILATKSFALAECTGLLKDKLITEHNAENLCLLEGDCYKKKKKNRCYLFLN